MENRNSVYAAAYARKILGVTIEDIRNLKRSKSSVKPINKHGNYDGTDVGFTSKSIESYDKQKKKTNQNKDYDSTDAGFTSKF